MHYSYCEFCEACKDDTEVCAATRSALECTREAGHDGQHVACGMDTHEMLRWRDE